MLKGKNVVESGVRKTENSSPLFQQGRATADVVPCCVFRRCQEQVSNRSAGRDKEAALPEFDSSFSSDEALGLRASFLICGM